MTARVSVLAPTLLLLLVLMALVAKSLQRTLEEPNYEGGNEADSWENEDLMSLRRRILESLGIDEAHVTELPASEDKVGAQDHVHGARTTHMDMDTDTFSSSLSSYTTYTSTFTESDEGRWPAFTSSENIDLLRLSFQVPHSKDISGNYNEEVTQAILRLPLLPDIAETARTLLWTMSSGNNASSSSTSSSSLNSAAFVFGKMLQSPEGPLVMEWDVTELVHSASHHHLQYYSFMVRCNDECVFVSGAPSTLTLTLKWYSKGLKNLRRTRRGGGESRHRSRKLTAEKQLSQFDPLHEAQVDCGPAKGAKPGRGSGVEQCCRKSMEVTFADLKLQRYIVSPSSFNAYYCVGKCNKRHNAASSHAVIQNYMHRKKKVPRSCCAPSKLSHLNVTFVVGSGAKMRYETKEWKNVIVEECACS